MVGSLALQQAQHFLTTAADIHSHRFNPEQQQQQKSRESSLPCPVSQTQVKSLTEFKQIHAQFIKQGFDQVPRQAGELLSLCALSEWGSMDYAASIFFNMEKRGVFDFNTMIRAYVKHYNPVSAILTYIDMLQEGVNPDNFTFPFVLKACSQLSFIAEGKQIHGHLIKFEFDSDTYIKNSLINMYGKCCEIELSRKVFDEMGRSRTVASWSSLLAAHTRMTLWKECIELFAAMRLEGLKEDESCMVSVLTSCGNLGALDLGTRIHALLLRNFSELNVVVQTSLIDMYVKCGQLDKAREIFDRMADMNEWTYSVMISGMAMHGDGDGAVRIFSSMLKKGLQPDEATYVGVLSACSHAGLLEEGRRCFDRMRFEHRLTPSIQHYGCMVDLMARAGRLQESFELIQRMPREPHDAAWRSLLSGCRIHGNNIKLAEIAVENLVKLGACNAGDYVILSNMYAKSCKWNDAARTRTKIVDRSLVQVPGFSRVEVKGTMHTFVSHEKLHPQSEDVHEMLYQMEWQLRFEGYLPDTSEVTADVDEEEKRRIIGGHSQKLAIAFSLLNTSCGSTIRIFTNLRMSNECHAYTALISKIFERKIVVRDRNRFHHFKEGECSCGGYW